MQARFRVHKKEKDEMFVKDLEARSTFYQPSLANITQIFKFIDVTGDGSISVAEFTSAIRRAGMYVDCVAVMHGCSDCMT